MMRGDRGGQWGGGDLPNPKTSARAGAPNLGAVTNSKSHLAAKLNILRLEKETLSARWCCKQPGTFFSSLFHDRKRQKKVPYFVVAVFSSRTYVLYNVHRFVNNNVYTKIILLNLINRFNTFIKSFRDYHWESV